MLPSECYGVLTGNSSFYSSDMTTPFTPRTYGDELTNNNVPLAESIKEQAARLKDGSKSIEYSQSNFEQTKPRTKATTIWHNPTKNIFKLFTEVKDFPFIWFTWII